MNKTDLIKQKYDSIIEDYLRPYGKITFEDMRYMIEHKENINGKYFKIINNKLYQKNPYNSWETRIEAFKYMMLKTLEKYQIPNCEFILFDDDGVNETNIHNFMKDNKILPIINSTSVLDKYQMILCPDFTFSFAPEYSIKNNEEMCIQIVKNTEKLNWYEKISKIVWRGGLTDYRRKYMCSNEMFDIKNIPNYVNYRGQKGNMFEQPNALSREEKCNYQYQLHCNGHNGNNVDGAYSCAFKWALMCRSLVFYSAPDKYREFWYHPSIFIENEHFIYTKSPEELKEKYEYFRNHPQKSKIIADNSFIFFNDYLLNYDIIVYYMQKLLTLYSQRLDYEIFLDHDDILIENKMYNEFLDT